MSKKPKVPRAKLAASPTCLLDGHVLVALMGTTHIHHEAAERWFESCQGNFATCPTTQGTLLRLVMQLDQVPVETAVELLMHLVADARHGDRPASVRIQGAAALRYCPHAHPRCHAA
jgi:predicted nucleic acid-binding protein